MVLITTEHAHFDLTLRLKKQARVAVYNQALKKRHRIGINVKNSCKC